MNKSLLEILACPVCKGELLFDKNKQELICQFDQIAFPIIDGIPVMIESRAKQLKEGEE